MNLNFCQKTYYLSCRYEYKELKKEIEEFINTRLNNNSFLTEKNVKNNENYQTSQVDPAKEGIISKNFEIIIKTAFFFLNLMGLAILNHISKLPKGNKKDYILPFAFVISIIKKNLAKKKFTKHFEIIIINTFKFTSLLLHDNW